MMPRGPKPPKSSGVAPAALAAPATITQAPTWAPSWATSNTPTNVKSPSTTKKGTSSPKTRVREASEESEYEYVYSDVEVPRVPADAPLDMPAGFPGEKPVRVVTPQGSANARANQAQPTPPTWPLHGHLARRPCSLAIMRVLQRRQRRLARSHNTNTTVTMRKITRRRLDALHSHSRQGTRRRQGRGARGGRALITPVSCMTVRPAVQPAPRWLNPVFGTRWRPHAHLRPHLLQAYFLCLPLCATTLILTPLPPAPPAYADFPMHRASAEGYEGTTVG